MDTLSCTYKSWKLHEIDVLLPVSSLCPRIAISWISLHAITDVNLTLMRLLSSNEGGCWVGRIVQVQTHFIPFGSIIRKPVLGHFSASLCSHQQRATEDQQFVLHKARSIVPNTEISTHRSLVNARSLILYIPRLQCSVLCLQCSVLWVSCSMLGFSFKHSFVDLS